MEDLTHHLVLHIHHILAIQLVWTEAMGLATSRDPNGKPEWCRHWLLPFSSHLG